MSAEPCGWQVPGWGVQEGGRQSHYWSAPSILQLRTSPEVRGLLGLQPPPVLFFVRSGSLGLYSWSFSLLVKSYWLTPHAGLWAGCTQCEDGTWVYLITLEVPLEQEGRGLEVAIAQGSPYKRLAGFEE